jgi:hypothetical protein
MTDLRPESQKKIDEAYLDYPNPGDFPEFDAGKYGITEFKQAIANVEVATVLSSGSAEFGTKIDAATMPTGGTGNLGWLSAIWKLISDRIPALSNGKIPVEVGSLNVSISNASLEIANDVGNPVPISDAGGSITVDGTFWQATQPISASSLPLPTGAATSVNQTTANTSLSSIDGKIPVLGQALATASTPVVLPATQITALTPPTSVGISGTLPAFTSTPTFNLGTAPSLTFTNTSFTANAGTNLNTSALALESGNLAGINGKLPASLGAKAASASLAVAPAFAATSTLTNVASSTTSVTLLAANNNRKTVIILNDSTSDLYIVWGASAASTANYSFILAGKGGGTPSSASFTGEDYSGQVTGIWISANGNARITETA